MMQNTHVDHTTITANNNYRVVLDELEHLIAHSGDYNNILRLSRLYGPLSFYQCLTDFSPEGCENIYTMSDYMHDLLQTDTF